MERLPSPTFRPLYQQIKVLLTQSLISREWGPGDAIPSETELASRYKVSQGTVRKAINELVDENVLIRHQGKGTFVASYNEGRRVFHFFRISSDARGLEYPEGELIDCRRDKADGTIATLLEVRPGSLLTVIERCVTISGKVFAYEEIRLPSALFKGLNAELINANECKMYSMFETVYGVRVLQVAEQVKAVAADTQTAKLLGVASGAPLLSIERVSYTFNDKPVEWRKSLCNTQEHHYMNKII
jgi:GntR family transcriptional regulator